MALRRKRNSRRSNKSSDAMERKDRDLHKGIALILLSAGMACTGQLLWKLAARSESLLLVAAGLALYGGGALLMIIALKYGELSVLHPMMSAGYVLSLVLGALVLNEHVTVPRIIGVAVIIVGLIFLSSSEGKDGA